MQSLDVKILGLYTHPNKLSEIPRGSLIEAENIVIDQESIAQPRRGFEDLKGEFSGVPLQLINYQDTLIMQHGNTVSKYVNEKWIPFEGTHKGFEKDDMATVQSNSNLYIATDEGILKLDSIGLNKFVRAGISKAFKPYGVLKDDGVAINIDRKVAYRVVWGYKDFNNNLILSAPSQRFVISNTKIDENDIESRDVELKIKIPNEITTNHFLQIYRSDESANASSEPNDECGMVYETNPSSEDIDTGVMTVRDVAPPALRGATLYTSPSQEGLLQANESPPMAKDLAFHKNTLFFANTKAKQRYFFSLLAVGGTRGIQKDDRIVITRDQAHLDIVIDPVFQTKDISAAQSIAATAMNLVDQVNEISAEIGVDAYYISGPRDLPGKILLEERYNGGTSFKIESNNETAFYPVLKDFDGITESTIKFRNFSTTDRFKNALYFSKYQNPEAVPLGNYFLVGNSDSEILRILPLRDSLFILKTEGIFRLSGDSAANYSVELFDNSTKILAPKTAVALNNRVYMLSDQGIVSVSDTGVQVISRAIEHDILETCGKNTDLVREKSFALSYETERKYIIFMFEQDKKVRESYPVRALVFNVFTMTWTQWNLSKSCGMVNSSDNKIYLGDHKRHKIGVERKTYSNDDHCDHSFEVIIEQIDGKKIYLKSLEGIEIGDLIRIQKKSYFINKVHSRLGFIEITTEVKANMADSISHTLTLSINTLAEISAVLIFKSFRCAIRWVPTFGDNPGAIKHYRETTLFFDVDNFHTANVDFISEKSSRNERVNVQGNFRGRRFGSTPFGRGGFGGAGKPHNIRTYVPRNKQRCAQLTVGFSLHVSKGLNFKLNGYSAVFDYISERVDK